MVDLTLALIVHEHATELLEPLRRLTRTRADLGPGVLAAALTTLREGPDPGATACVTELVVHVTVDALDGSVLGSLIIAAGAPEERFGFEQPRPNDPAAIRVVADVAPDSVMHALLDLLPLPSESSSLVLPTGTPSRSPEHVDDFTRASACGTARALATTHPHIAGALVDRLVRSLAVDADDYNEDTPIHAAQQALATILVLDVGDVATLLETAGRHGAKELRNRLIGVIERATHLLDPRDRWRQPDDPQLDGDHARRLRDQLQTICLARIGGDWGWDISYRAASAAAGLATVDPDWALHQLHGFVGAFLTTVAQANTPRSVNLAVVDGTPPFLAGLEEMNRQSSIASTARELLDAVRVAADADPQRVCAEIVTVLADERDTERGQIVRRNLIPVLGDVGRRHGHERGVLNEILPVLHSYVVDTDAGLRAAALRAWTEIGVAHDLPSSVADLLPALTTDHMVVVIEALLEAARRLRWTDDDRATLFVYAINICLQVPAAPDNKMLTEAMSALRSLTRDDDATLQAAAQSLILERAAELDNHKLEDELRGRWLPELRHSARMAALQLRLARDPVINDRLNARDDTELCALLECGPGLATLQLQDLVDAAVELGSDRTLASAEFAEVAWRAGNADEAARVMRAVFDAIPSAPAFNRQRVLALTIAEAADFDAAIARGEQLQVGTAKLDDAVGNLDTGASAAGADLVEQIRARIAIRELLSQERPPARHAAQAPASDDPANTRRQRADLLTVAREALTRLSQRATPTAAYIRLVAALCDVAAHLLRLDAAELDGDPTAAQASAVAARRRAEFLEAEVRERFVDDDPIGGALLQACATAQTITSGGAVAHLLEAWGRLPMPLLIVDGPRRSSRDTLGSTPTEASEVALSEPDVAVVLASIDGHLITGPQVLRPDWVYELSLEVQPGMWPEWAEWLDAEILGHLRPTEITLPTFSWTRSHITDGTLVGAGSMVLRFGLPAGQPAPPFVVRLQWRGTRDGEQVSEPLDVAGHRQLRFRPFDASRDFLTDFPVVDARLLALYEDLHGAGYDEDQIQAFCRLFTALCRVGFRMTWDKQYKRGSEVSERSFHDDLFARLLEEPELARRLERGTPLALGYLDVRHDGITAELKVERQTPVTEENAPKYMGQPTQYAAADGARLSILCVLDMSAKESPIGTPENYMFTLQPALHGLENPEAPSLVVAIVVNGSLPTPSSWSRRKTRLQRDTDA